LANESSIHITIPSLPHGAGAANADCAGQEGRCVQHERWAVACFTGGGANTRCSIRSTANTGYVGLGLSCDAAGLLYGLEQHRFDELDAVANLREQSVQLQFHPEQRGDVFCRSERATITAVQHHHECNHQHKITKRKRESFNEYA